MLRKVPSNTLNRQPRQRGWIMLEVIVCLALFAVVLKAVQHQSEVQWRTLQQTEAYRKNQENEQKQAVMEQLMGPVSWLTDPQDASNNAYPECQQCTGDQLKQWFYATQHNNKHLQKSAGAEP